MSQDTGLDRTVAHDIGCEHFAEAANLAATVQVQWEELDRLREQVATLMAGLDNIVDLCRWNGVKDNRALMERFDAIERECALLTSHEENE